MNSFVFSVVGFDETSPVVNAANVFGTVSADHEEYARRKVVDEFRRTYPTHRIASIGIVPNQFQQSRAYNWEGVAS